MFRGVNMIVSLKKLATVYLAFSSVMSGLRPFTVGAIRKMNDNENQNLGKDNLQGVGVSKKEFEEKTNKELSKENYHFIIETSRKRYQNFDINAFDVKAHNCNSRACHPSRRSIAQNGFLGLIDHLLS
jgi:helix-turn-helix protein